MRQSSKKFEHHSSQFYCWHSLPLRATSTRGRRMHRHRHRPSWTARTPAAIRLQPATTPATTGETVASPRKNPTVPVIGGGDLLKVSVLGVPDSDQEVRVDADGNISLNFIGAVKVAGQTTDRPRQTIAKKLVAGGFFTIPRFQFLPRNMPLREFRCWAKCRSREFIPAGCAEPV